MFGLGRIEGSLFGLSRGYSVGYAIAFKRMRWAGDWRRIKDVFIYVLSCNGASLVPQTVKNLPAMWGTLVLSPGEGNGNPLPYSCLKNSMDRGAWQTWLSDWAPMQSINNPTRKAWSPRSNSKTDAQGGNWLSEDCWFWKLKHHWLSEDTHEPG